MASEGRSIQSIEVGGRLLLGLVEAGRPMSLRDLAQQAQIAPAQAHAYLVSYRRHGLVEQDAKAGAYSLGPFALQLGIARMRSFDSLRMAGDALVAFASEVPFTVALSVWGTHGPTVVQLQESRNQIYTRLRVGTVCSVSGTATGRAFAAFMPESLIREAVEQENAEGAASKRVGQAVPFKQVKATFNLTRYRGYATIDPLPIPGINAIAAPVFDHLGQMQMAVTVTGSAARLSPIDPEPIARQLLGFTRYLSGQMGYEEAMPRGSGEGADPNMVSASGDWSPPSRKDKQNGAG